jgi:hypothetical protein
LRITRKFFIFASKLSRPRLAMFPAIFFSSVIQRYSQTDSIQTACKLWVSHKGRESYARGVGHNFARPCVLGAKRSLRYAQRTERSGTPQSPVFCGVLRRKKYAQIKNPLLQLRGN